MLKSSLNAKKKLQYYFSDKRDPRNMYHAFWTTIVVFNADL